MWWFLRLLMDQVPIMSVCQVFLRPESPREDPAAGGFAQDLYFTTGVSQTLVECSGEDNPTLTASSKSLARRHAAAETFFVCYRGTLRPPA